MFSINNLILIVLLCCYSVISGNVINSTTSTSNDYIITTENPQNIINPLEENNILDKTTENFNDPLITEIDGFKSPNNELSTTEKNTETSSIDYTHFSYNNGDVDNFLSLNETSIGFYSTEINYCQNCKFQDTEISGLEYNITNQTVYVTWDSINENETIPDCKYNYSIELNGFKDFIWNKNNAGFEFPTKEFCGLYQLKLFARNLCNHEANSSLFINILPETDAFSLKTKIINSSKVLIQIEHSQIYANCNTTGTVQISLTDNNSSDVILEKDFNLYHLEVIEFNETIPCAKYNVTTDFNVMEDNFYRTESVEIPSAKPLEFEVAINKINTTFAEIQIIIPPKELYMCQIPEAKIKCNNIIENSILESDFERWIISELFPFTQYNCTAKIFNINGEFKEATFSFTTLEDAPDAVKHLEIVNITETSFTVTWENPKNLYGILREYKISIFGKSLYKSPNYCMQKDYNKTFSYFNVTGSNHFLKVENLFENYEYNVTIQAKTTKLGPGIYKLLRTKYPKPQQVKDIKYEIEILNENKPKAYLSWKYPCHTYTSPENTFFLIEVNVQEHNQGKYSTRDKIHVNPDVQELENLTHDLFLTPSSNYTIRIFTLLNSESAIDHVKPYEINFTSPGGNTTKPLDVKVLQENSLNMNISWRKPEQIFGNLIAYKINIISLDYLIPNNCNYKMQLPYNDNTSNTYYVYMNPYAYHKYKIEVGAITTEGVGLFQTVEYITKSNISEPIRNLEQEILEHDFEHYNVSVFIRYEPPCSINGIFKYYEIVLKDEQGNVIHNGTEEGLDHHFPASCFRPETKYLITIGVVNDFGESFYEHEFQTPAGIPHEVNLDAKTIISSRGSTQVTVLLRNDYFDNENGEICYYAILVGAKDFWKEQKPFGEWDDLWPEGNFWNNSGHTYQATPRYWRDPLLGSVKEYLFTLGKDNCTNVINQYCNGPLQANTEYVLVIRGFTSKGYRDSNKLHFETLDDFNKSNNVVLIIGIIAGVLIVVVLAGFGCLYWKRRPEKPCSDMSKIPTEEPESIFPFSVKVEDFPKYYNSRKAILPDEYASLKTIGDNLDKKFAEMQENKKKNRYINILPYDSTRVTSPNSNQFYINASYIKGYSEKIEYIATQGPLESTVHDFWKMIIGENCKVIAMVAQFREQNKIKCNQYFPKCREQLDLEDDDDNSMDMTIRCSYELNYGFYVERQILVQTGETQHTITHLQFLNWPDFGCPEGTENMLKFTLILRKSMEANNSISVIHCSAGVGRTGTLIAVDILLQAIRDNKEINIHETVLTLRQQRQKMVQAEAQYLYIYKCINDAILQPVEIVESKSIEPIYENLDNMIEMTVLTNDNNNCSQQQEDVENECNLNSSNENPEESILEDQNNEEEPKTLQDLVENEKHDS